MDRTQWQGGCAAGLLPCTVNIVQVSGPLANSLHFSTVWNPLGWKGPLSPLSFNPCSGQDISHRSCYLGPHVWPWASPGMWHPQPWAAVPWSCCSLSQCKMSLFISSCVFFFIFHVSLLFLLLLELASSISSLLCTSPLSSHFPQNADNNLSLCGTFPNGVTELSLWQLWSVVWIPACNSVQIDLGKQLKGMHSKTDLSAVPCRASSSPSLFCHSAKLPQESVIPSNTWKLSPCSCLRTEHRGTFVWPFPGWQNCWAQHNHKVCWFLL